MDKLKTSPSFSSENLRYFLIDIFENIHWNDNLEKRLCQLYIKEDVVDIFWGQNILTDGTTCDGVTEDPIVHFISEKNGFIDAEIPPQSSYDPLPTMKMVLEIY
ncbi:hypothetical protein Glove_295g46 [Diversispora epigaea]|uniref:Uncharacterized protein n=1 Tax=Diversispora epigaea TaxID=1348612 RepID=A0A397I3K4_9GLOM|nr:hypothetical protein Glove_295g46 [Diversispora epigaea]